MACQDDFTIPSSPSSASKPPLPLTLPEQLLESLLEQLWAAGELWAGGLVALPEAMRRLMNAALRTER